MAALLLCIVLGVYSISNPFAAKNASYTVEFNNVVQQVSPFDIGIVSSTYGATPLSSPEQRAAEQRIDARYVRIPVGYRNDRVTSSAGGGPAGLDIPALVKLYQSWGYHVLVTIGGQTNDADVHPGDATKIIRALGTGPNIDYSAPNEVGSQGKTIQDQIDLAHMIVKEGKAIDPAFKIWGPAEAYYDRSKIKTFAAAIGPDLAGINYHHYAMGESSLSTAQALSETPSYEQEIKEIRSDLASLGLDIPVTVGELNFSWRYYDGTSGGNDRFFSAINTVWMASSLGHILKAGGRGLPYATQNGALGVTVEKGKLNPDNRPASSPMPAYWGIAAWTGASIWPHFKDKLYSTTTNDASGEVFAVNNEAGGYNLVLINKDEDNVKEAKLKLNGIPSGNYKLYQTNPAAPYDQPELIKESTYTGSGSIALTLPEMSVTVMELQPNK